MKLFCVHGHPLTPENIYLIRRKPRSRSKGIRKRKPPQPRFDRCCRQCSLFRTKLAYKPEGRLPVWMPTSCRS